MRRLAALVLTATAMTACTENGFTAFRDPGPDGPRIEVTPTRLDFGAAAAGSPVTKEFLIRNVGVTELEVLDLFINGEADSYSIDQALPLVLDPEGSAVINVTFAPRQPEEVVGYVQIVSTDEVESAPEVDLVGFGKVPALRIDPPELDFGAVSIGCEDDAGLRLSNVGNETLIIDDLVYDGDIELGLLDLPGLPLELAPGASTDLGVSFAPDAERDYDGTLTVSSNDPRGAQAALQVGDGIYGDRVVDRFEMPVAPPVDILFAIDQSCSMEDDATRLGSNFATFVSEINKVTTGWRVGVATRDNGCFRDGYYDAGRRNYQDLFKSAVLAWDGGAYTESLLTVARNALRESRSGCNAGFLRPEALLHVILVSDEPEQSWESWSSLVDQIRNQHPSDRDRVKISAVAGDYPRGCGTAMAGEGYWQAVDATDGEYLSICDSNWARHVDSLAKASVEGLGRFDLSGTPDPRTLTVYVNSATWTSGFHLDGNTLVFDESPPEGAAIRVEYGALGCR